MRLKICYILTVPITVRAFFIPQLKYLSDNGFDVTVICSSDANLQEELGQDIHFLPVDMPRGLSIFGSLSVISRLVKILKKEKFDLVQYSTPNAGLYGAIASKICNVRVRNYHLMGFRYLGASGVLKSILKLIEKLTCKLSTSIECVSNSNLELGVKEGIFTREKACVVWNGSTGGVDLKRFDYSKRDTWRKEIRNKLGIDENDFVYGFVGRITKDKGIDELFEAYEEINNNSKLLMVGDFEEKEQLNQELLNTVQNDENVIFVGSVQDVEKYYAAMDVLILPSYREGFGNVIIEAGAMGTSAIVTNIPGPKEIVGKIGGKICLPHESKSLINCMEHFDNVRFNNISKKVKQYYDQDELNKYILLRKNALLKNNEVAL